MKRARVYLAVAVLGCCVITSAVGEPSSRPDASDTAQAAGAQLLTVELR